MAQLNFSLYDDRRVVRACVRADVAESLLASLSADPETIGEFERAMLRFFAPEFAESVRAGWTESLRTGRNQPWQASLSIDLPGRLLVSQWEQSQRERHASFFDAQGCPQGRFPYDLSSQWLWKQSDIDQRQLALSRRAQRRTDQVDVRPVLFGEPMIEFFVEQSERAVADERPSLSHDWRAQRRNGWFRQDDELYRLVRKIHREWLLSRRSDLGGRRVRDVMLFDHEHIATDISHRTMQWTVQQKCPPGLSRSDAAFARGALGVHEIILYYNLVRELLFSYFEQAIEGQGVFNGVEFLANRRDEWMATQQSEDLPNLTPSEAIERERRRLPLVQTEGHAGLDDTDPVSRMSKELRLGPAFIYLDEIHFDDEFAFSMHAREDDWEAEQAAFEASCERYDLERERSRDDGADSPRSTDAIWQRVYVNQEFLGRSISEDVMAIGFFLAELVEDVKCELGDDELVTRINRHFGNLAPAARESHSVLWPVVSQLGETIDDVAQQCPRLAEKCLDLQNHLARLAEMLEQ